MSSRWGWSLIPKVGIVPGLLLNNLLYSGFTTHEYACVDPALSQCCGPITGQGQSVIAVEVGYSGIIARMVLSSAQSLVQRWASLAGRVVFIFCIL